MFNMHHSHWELPKHMAKHFYFFLLNDVVMVISGSFSFAHSLAPFSFLQLAIHSEIPNKMETNVVNIAVLN